MTAEVEIKYLLTEDTMDQIQAEICRQMYQHPEAREALGVIGALLADIATRTCPVTSGTNEKGPARGLIQRKKD